MSDSWHDPMATGTRLLEHQVKRLLARGYAAVDAQGVLANRPRTLHVTFDDAYRNVESVLGVLERLAVPATIFACAGLAERGDRFAVPELCARLPQDEDELLTMSFDKLGELAERGVEIGSHTVSHPHLTELGDDELREEVRSSRERFEARLGRPCRFLAYPYGDHNARVQQATRTAGYAAAFTLEPPAGVYRPFALPRVGVHHKDTTLRFTVKTSRSRELVVAARTRGVLRALGARR